MVSTISLPLKVKGIFITTGLVYLTITIKPTKKYKGFSQLLCEDCVTSSPKFTGEKIKTKISYWN